MTEKRFKLKYINEQHISANLYDNKTFIGAIGIGEELIVELLNGLSEENEQLKEALIELKEIGDYQYARIKELSDENEQLEQTNQRLTIALKEIKEKTNIYLEMTKGEDQP